MRDRWKDLRTKEKGMLEGQDHRFEKQDMVNKDFGEVRKDEK